MHAPLPNIIKALLEPERYPDPAQRVELIETLISWLLLAGEFAYKIKKPITLSFLDYGTLERRRVCCEAELRLNRRFAPDIYLDVVAIVGTPDNPRFGDEGAPIEFAVKMHRFDEAGRLDRVCARGELAATQVSALADAIIAFHRDAAIPPFQTRFGSPNEVLAPMLANFQELNTLLSDEECRIKLGALLTWTHQEFNRLAAHFAARKAEGHVRECHGDLHLANLVLIDGRVMLFDCIEFNEDLRWIDVANDIAFTYVDLLDHHQPGLAGWLLNEWLSGSGDYDAIPVLRFYAAYRTLVQAKIAAIRAGQAQADISETREYIALAERLTSPPKPCLIITHGLAGCGKTTESTRLLQGGTKALTIRLRSDVERKRLFGLAASARSNSPLDGGIYGQEAHRLTYRRLQDLAKQLLEAGWSVIVDAAFLKRIERATFRALATQAGAEFHILAPQVSTAELRARIVARLEQGHDASEATLDVLELQMASIEPLDADERNCLL